MSPGLRQTTGQGLWTRQRWYESVTIEPLRLGRFLLDDAACCVSIISKH